MLEPIVVTSIYKNSTGKRILLPQRMALLDSDAAESIHALNSHMSAIGANFYLSDAYRTRKMQEKARNDYITNEKKSYSPPPGESIHEAGRAIDIDVDSLGIPLSRFWETALVYGWRPIISVPDPERVECWHFEYLAYWCGKPTDILPFRRCAVLEAYLENNICVISEYDRWFLLQGYLKLMGLYNLKVDGKPGSGTRGAIEKYKNIHAGNVTIANPDVIAIGQRVRGMWRHHTLRT